MSTEEQQTITVKERDEAHRAGRELARSLKGLGMTDAAATVDRLLELLYDAEAYSAYARFGAYRDEYERMRVQRGSVG